jgi:geranylgeranyl diphosphate synthase type II
MNPLKSDRLQETLKMSNDALVALEAYLKERKRIVDEALEQFLPGQETFPPTIFESVRYSVFAGGKRLRPILCMAAAEAVGGASKTVLPVACALEMIHTYSLIHDDLPAMDDDDYRRGTLTNHKVFGEGIAILAGDALLTEAFHLMSAWDRMKGVSADRLVRVINEIAKAAGFFGMVGGQVADLESEGQAVDNEILDYIHVHKTEAMITVSIRVGAILSDAREEELKSLTEYGKKIGLAFQIADDILDIESSRDVLGKDTGSDEERKKVTYPALLGLEPSRKKAFELVQEALADIQYFDEKADPLRSIAQFIVERKS